MDSPSPYIPNSIWELAEGDIVCIDTIRPETAQTRTSYDLRVLYHKKDDEENQYMSSIWTPYDGWQYGWQAKPSKLTKAQFDFLYRMYQQ